MMRASVVLFLLLPACTFLIVRPKDPTTTGGIDGGSTSGGPTCPAVATTATHTADVLVFVRMAGQTASLAGGIDGLVSNIVADIGSRKVTVAHVMIAPLVAEPSVPTPFYFDSCGAPAPLGITAALQYFAPSVSSPNLSVSEHEEAASLGADLTTIIPSYPPDFLGDATPPPASPFFVTPPTYTLVVFVDPLARAHALAGSQVDGQSVDAYFTAGTNGMLDWLAYGGQHLPVGNVFYLSINTSEFSETQAAMNKRCLAIPGFSENTLDFLQPADFTYFTAFSASIDKSYRQRSSVIDFCDALSFNAVSLVATTISGIHADLGLQK